MIVCPNCNHQNPEGASQCEACYTPLPTTTSCPNCGTPVQTDATFCGQCGFNLQVELPNLPQPISEEEIKSPPESEPIPETIVNQPEASQAEIPQEAQLEMEPTIQSPPIIPPEPPVDPLSEPLLTKLPITTSEPIMPSEPPITPTSEPIMPSELPITPISEPIMPSEPEITNPPSTPASAVTSATKIQIQTPSLLHVQTNTKMELPQNLSVIHLGKPNEKIPPDIDISGFPNSEIVSRIHADIRVEGDTYYIEDVGSANGTYINHTPLSTGDRHRLRVGDRIALGKGDKVTFFFQLS
ncbi:MAG: FHA domain-containing protein [Moorea sp. SIO2B7]|nr:FHA domain-containing protein [Moorena sp. SIO2B7]